MTEKTCISEVITIVKNKTKPGKLNYVCDNADTWLILMLRVAVGAIFIVTGYAKLTASAAFPPFMESIWQSAPMFWQYLAGIIEFLGGIGVLLGIMPRTSSILLGLVTFFAIITLHLGGGYANALVLLASLGLVFHTGFRKWAAWHKW